MPEPVAATTPTPATPAPAPVPAAPAPADAKAPDAPTPQKLARQKLDEVTKARREAEAARVAAEKAKAEAEPLTKKAAEFTADMALLNENPRAFLEKHGIDRTLLTEKLAAEAIADVEAKTPEGQVAELKKQIDEMKAASEKEKQDAAKAGIEKQRDAYRETLVAAIVPEKYPFTANALDGLVTRDEMKAALFQIGGQLWQEKVKGLTKEQTAAAKEPTPDEVCAEAEKRYRKVHETLSKQREVAPAPAAEKKETAPKTQMAPSTKLKDRKAKAHAELRERLAKKK